MTTERLTAADGPQADEWANDPAPARAAQAQTPEERRVSQIRGSERVERAMARIAGGLDELDRNLPRAMERLTDDLDYGALAETVAWLQGMKARLGVAEAYVARELGRMDGVPEVIELPDGRTAQVNKGKDRKEWRHDDWKHDVRAEVAVRASEAHPDGLVDAATGEPMDVVAFAMPLLAQVQAVHGSAAPKVTALKPLGLSADDYCTSSPGPYSVRISTPTDTTTEG